MTLGSKTLESMWK